MIFPIRTNKLTLLTTIVISNILLIQLVLSTKDVGDQQINSKTLRKSTSTELKRIQQQQQQQQLPTGSGENPPLISNNNNGKSETKSSLNRAKTTIKKAKIGIKNSSSSSSSSISRRSSESEIKYNDQHDQQQQSASSSSAGSGAGGIYQPVSLDSWHPHNLMPTFTDQEQGDEMVALASESEVEQVKILPSIRTTNFTSLNNSYQQQTNDWPIAARDLQQQQQQQENININNNNNPPVELENINNKQTTLASPINKSKSVLDSQRQQMIDEYYSDAGDIIDEDDQDESQQQQQQQQQSANAGGGGRKTKNFQNDERKERNSKFRAASLDMASQYNNNNGDQFISAPIYYEDREQPTQIKSNNNGNRSAKAFSADKGWLPASSGMSTTTTTTTLPSLISAGVSNSKGTGEKLAELFGGAGSSAFGIGGASGNLASKADMAIEYLRNVLKDKQKEKENKINDNIRQYENDNNNNNNKQQDRNVSLHRLTSFATRLSQMMLNNNNSSSNNYLNETSVNSNLDGSNVDEFENKKNIFPPNQIEKTFLAQQADVKFSISDVKPTTTATSGLYEFNPSTSSLSSTTKLPFDQQQSFSNPFISVGAGNGPNSMAPSPLGGDYIENYDDYSKGLQHQLVGQQYQRQQLFGVESNPIPTTIQHHQSLNNHNNKQLASSNNNEANQQFALSIDQQQKQTKQFEPPTSKRFFQMHQNSHLPPVALPNSLVDFQQQQQQHHQQHQQQQQIIEQHLLNNQYQQRQPNDFAIIQQQQRQNGLNNYQINNKTELSIKSVVPEEVQQQPKQLNTKSKQPQIIIKQEQQQQQQIELSPAQPQPAQQIIPIQSIVPAPVQAPISSKLYNKENSQNPLSPSPSPSPFQQQQQPLPLPLNLPPQLNQHQQQPLQHQQQQQHHQNHHQAASKIKPPKIVSYNYFESDQENVSGGQAAQIDPTGLGELFATNYQLGDALYSSTGGLEKSLTQTELEAIQSQFLTAEHPIVQLPDHNTQQQQQQQQYQQQHLNEDNLAGLLANLKPNNYGQDVLQKLTSPEKQAEETLKELASNHELNQMSILPPPPPPQHQQQQQQQSHANAQQHHAQLSQQPIGHHHMIGNRPLINNNQQQHLQREQENKRLSKSGLADFLAVPPKKKSLIVYLNHPRPVDMSKVTNQGESFNLAQSVNGGTNSDQSIGDFVSAKEFDSHGHLSKDNKHLDISNLNNLGLEGTGISQSQADKEGLSVVVIGDAYKYKKIVLLISSKSGGLKFIPMVKDMKK